MKTFKSRLLDIYSDEFQLCSNTFLPALIVSGIWVKAADVSTHMLLANGPFQNDFFLLTLKPEAIGEKIDSRSCVFRIVWVVLSLCSLGQTRSIQWIWLTREWCGFSSWSMLSTNHRYKSSSAANTALTDKRCASVCKFVCQQCLANAIKQTMAQVSNETKLKFKATVWTQFRTHFR